MEKPTRLRKAKIPWASECLGETNGRARRALNGVTQRQPGGHVRQKKSVQETVRKNAEHISKRASGATRTLRLSEPRMGVQTPTEYQFLKSKNTVERLEQNVIREGMDGGGRGRCPDGCERRQSAPRGLVFVSRNWRLQLSKRSEVWTDLDAAEGLPVEDRLQEALLPPLAAGSTARDAGGARERSWMDRGAKTVAFDKEAPAGAADGLLQVSRLAERPSGSRGDQKLH